MGIGTTYTRSMWAFGLAAANSDAVLSAFFEPSDSSNATSILSTAIMNLLPWSPNEQNADSRSITPMT